MPVSPSIPLTPSMTALLDALSAEHGASVAELAERAGLGRSTAARVLTVLEKEGLARRERAGERVPDLWFAARVPAEPVPDEPVEPAAASDLATRVEEPDHCAPGCEPVSQNTDSDAREDETQPVDEPGPEDPPVAPDADEYVRQEADGPEPEPRDEGSEPGGESGEQPDPGVADDPGEQAPESADEPDVPGEDAGEPAVRAPATVESGEGAAQEEAPHVAASEPGGPRLAKGGLRALVVAHLRTHPAEEFTASKLGRVLGKSSGAIANALDTLVGLGSAEMTCEKPRTFRHLEKTES